MLKTAVFLAAIPALIVVTVTALALAVVAPGLLLVWRLNRPQATPP